MVTRDLIVYLTKHLTSTKEDIERVFSDFIDDAENMTQEQFDDCIKYSQEKGWENWETAFIDWKDKGKIPFVEVE